MMGLKHEAFTRTKLDSKKTTFPVRITDDMADWFLEAKKIIRQPKNSTALKQLAKLGYLHVLQDEKMKEILDTVLNNSRRNQRIGITEGEYQIDK